MEALVQISDRVFGAFHQQLATVFAVLKGFFGLVDFVERLNGFGTRDRLPV